MESVWASVLAWMAYSSAWAAFGAMVVARKMRREAYLFKMRSRRVSGGVGDVGVIALFEGNNALLKDQ